MCPFVTHAYASLASRISQVGLTIAQEMTDFTNALYKLVDTHEVTRKHVMLWSVPPPPFEMQEIMEMCHTDDDESTLGTTQMTRTLNVDGQGGAYTQLDA